MNHSCSPSSVVGYNSLAFVGNTLHNSLAFVGNTLHNTCMEYVLQYIGRKVVDAYVWVPRRATPLNPIPPNRTGSRGNEHCGPMSVYSDILVLVAQGNLVSVLGAGVIEGHLLICLPPFHLVE
jgi:hypothetical protein